MHPAVGDFWKISGFKGSRFATATCLCAFVKMVVCLSLLFNKAMGVRGATPSQLHARCTSTTLWSRVLVARRVLDMAQHHSMRCTIIEVPQQQQVRRVCLVALDTRRRRRTVAYSCAATLVACTALAPHSSLLGIFAGRITRKGESFGEASYQRCARHMHAQDLEDRVKGRLCDKGRPCILRLVATGW